MQKLIECVPNFSEGRDLDLIRQITGAIESVDGVALLDVDPGGYISSLAADAMSGQTIARGVTRIYASGIARQPLSH